MKKQTAFDKARDERSADEKEPKPRHLFCAADGCPNLWSSDLNGHLCRWHRDAPKERWPEVTQQQQWDETERARMRGETKPPIKPTITHAEKLAIAQRMREVEQARTVADVSRRPVSEPHVDTGGIPMPNDTSRRFDDIPFPEAAS